MGYYYDKFDKCDKHDKDDRNPKFRRLNGLREGDAIQVFSAGVSLGTGTFIRIEDNFLVWVNSATDDLFVTNLDEISVRKITPGA
ncbi:hypothetical protein [Halalkalibacter nanhaiisediminis]|uniref:Uncharacterized protein n=1 Tax=Halalkalibacter nanhaiisediminis TaxID=688079 RepID=A0A562QB35_9BACI|nr:hypothetical protein [Halalkalibacter nanhaiisediminis]TWI53952.1 hypothetical protein IQ10_03262 [Halalkalibacter nanhaiisediminis]